MNHHFSAYGTRAELFHPQMSSMRGCSAVPTAYFSSVGSGHNNSVTFIEKIGAGVYGEVWRAEYKGRSVAAKTTTCPTGFRQHEIELLKRCQTTGHAVELLAVENDTPKGTVLVMELCDQSLQDLLERGGLDNEDAYLEALCQILEGLIAIHSEGVVFGDLKPDNILVRADGSLLFSDFGDARDARQDYRHTPVHQLGWGSPMYHARPDVMKKDVTTASDMWMFAQTAIHLFTRQQARQNPSRVTEDMPLSDLMRQCLETDPAKRPSAREAFLEVNHSLRLGSPPTPSPRRRGSIPGPCGSQRQAPGSSPKRRMSTSDADMYCYHAGPGAVVTLPPPVAYSDWSSGWTQPPGPMMW